MIFDPSTCCPPTVSESLVLADRRRGPAGFRRVAEVSGVQDDKASGDAVATGVALVLFWPAAFLIKGDGATAAELGRLKGEFEALEQASIQKRCGLRFERPTATTAEATKAGRKKAAEAAGQATY